MSGSIFVLDKNNTITELKETQYSSEDIFQELIEKYPNILAGDQITPDNPRKWIFISREMGIPDKEDSNNRWYLDHLFIDQDAIPTFVEVKRSTDTRLRREVVAQMLDYAANATKYWSMDKIKQYYNDQGRDLYDDIGIEADNQELYWDNVKSNLRTGKIRLLFVADVIPHTLKRIIEFLNNQMVDTEVLGLEIKQYISDSNLKTFVPRIVGQTSNSIAIKRQTNNSKWDQDSFINEVENIDEGSINICLEIINKFKDNGCRIDWGGGKVTSSFVPIYEGKQRHQLFVVYAYKNGLKIELYFQHYKEPYFDINKKNEMQSKLSNMLGIKIDKDKLNKRPSFSIDILKDKDVREEFINYYLSIVDEIKSQNY